jgi:hypothetical protein
VVGQVPKLHDFLQKVLQWGLGSPKLQLLPPPEGLQSPQMQGCMNSKSKGYAAAGRGRLSWLRVNTYFHYMTRHPHRTFKMSYKRNRPKVYRSQCFFLANFRNLATKKKAGESNKGILKILKNNSPYLDQNQLEVARFRQCVPAGRQNQPGLQKRSTSPPRQSPFYC